MSHGYTPTPRRLTSTTLPDDGDDGFAASVNVPFQDLADGILYAETLLAPLIRVAPFHPRLTGVNATISYCLAPTLHPGIFLPTNASGDGGFFEASMLGVYSFTDVNSVSTNTWMLAMPLDPDVLTDDRTLSKLELPIHPAGGHGALPVGMPALTIWRTLWDGSAPPVALFSGGTNGWVVDASVNTTAFQLQHTLTFIPDQNHLIDHSQYAYHLLFNNECGTNSLNGGSVHAARLTMV
jgi:hypothetical protein